MSAGDLWDLQPNDSFMNQKGDVTTDKADWTAIVIGFDKNGSGL
jgi:hypothetical protein